MSSRRLASPLPVLYAVPRSCRRTAPPVVSTGSVPADPVSIQGTPTPCLRNFAALGLSRRGIALPRGSRACALLSAKDLKISPPIVPPHPGRTGRLPGRADQTGGPLQGVTAALYRGLPPVSRPSGAAEVPDQDPRSTSSAPLPVRLARTWPSPPRCRQTSPDDGTGGCPKRRSRGPEGMSGASSRAAYPLASPCSAPRATHPRPEHTPTTGCRTLQNTPTTGASTDRERLHRGTP